MATAPERPVKPIPPTVPSLPSAKSPAAEAHSAAPDNGTNPANPPLSDTVKKATELGNAFQGKTSQTKPQSPGAEKPSPASPATADTTAAPGPAAAAAATADIPAGNTAAQTLSPDKNQPAAPAAISTYLWPLCTILLVAVAVLAVRYIERRLSRTAPAPRTVLDYSSRSRIVTGEQGIHVTVAPAKQEKQVKSNFEVRI